MFQRTPDRQWPDVDSSRVSFRERCLAGFMLSVVLCAEATAQGRIVYRYDDRGRLIEVGIDDGGDRRVISIGYGPSAQDNGNERYRIPIRVTGDTDADGLPDVWEDAHRLDAISSADAQADPDGDGQSNRQEYLTGGLPRLNLGALANALRHLEWRSRIAPAQRAGWAVATLLMPDSPPAMRGPQRASGAIVGLLLSR